MPSSVASSRALLTVALLVSGFLAAEARSQAPEVLGPHATTTWDAGDVTAAGVSIPAVVYYPTDLAGPRPLVGVIHGYGRNGSYHTVLAETLASRGFVVVLPDMPCSFIGGCDHAANADQLSALLAWAVAQGETAGTELSGRVDGTRRALIGHSWGALASHMTAAQDATLDAVVLFDPNDDGTQGLDVTDAITAPTLQLLAEIPGGCNSLWQEANVTPLLPTPRLQLTVAGSAHCDPEEPGDLACPFACGAGDASTSAIFRRYAVAWTTCLLTGDPAMASWLGGAGLAADESGAVVTGVVSSGLDALPCAGASSPDDAGPGPSDAGGPEGDAGPNASDAGGPAGDGGEQEPDPVADAGAGPDPAPTDAGNTLDGGAPGDGGPPDQIPPTECRCVAGGTAWPGGAVAALLLVALSGLRRRRVPTGSPPWQRSS